PLFTESATRVKTTPTLTAITNFCLLSYLGMLRDSHLGKKYRTSKKSAVVTVSTTICVRDKSGALNRTKKSANEKPIYPVITITVKRELAIIIVIPAIIIVIAKIHGKIPTGVSSARLNEKAFNLNNASPIKRPNDI